MAEIDEEILELVQDDPIIRALRLQLLKLEYVVVKNAKLYQKNNCIRSITEIRDRRSFKTG